MPEKAHAHRGWPPMVTNNAQYKIISERKCLNEQSMRRDELATLIDDEPRVDERSTHYTLRDCSESLTLLLLLLRCWR